MHRCTDRRSYDRACRTCCAEACLLVVPISYAAFLVWQEWHFREKSRLQRRSWPLLRAPSSLEILDTTAIATVLGLADEAARLPSAEPLTLQASFVVASGMSKALLADAQGSRIYQVGEQLPGGSVLRRIEPNQVVLWNKGREELLTVQSSSTRFLRRLESQDAPHHLPVSTRYLSPHLIPGSQSDQSHEQLHRRAGAARPAFSVILVAAVLSGTLRPKKKNGSWR